MPGDDQGATATKVRAMNPEEFRAVKDVSVAAFGDDPQIGLLLDLLRESWSWIDELSFVAERDGELVGQVLYTKALLDARERLVEVLLLSPVGVRPDLQNQGIGSKPTGRDVGLPRGLTRLLPEIRIREGVHQRLRGPVGTHSRRGVHGLPSSSI